MRTMCWMTCALIAVAGSAYAADSDEELTAEQKIAGLALVWQEANYNFAFFNLSPGLDWDTEFEKAIPKVMATEDTYAYIREMQRFVALLGEAHTNVEPGKAFRARYGGHPAVELEEIERKAMVVNTSRELAEEVPVGSVILAVDGVPVDRYLDDRVFPFMSASTEHSLWRQSIRGHRWRSVGLLMGEVDSMVEIEFETPDGASRRSSLPRLARAAEIEWTHLPRREKEVLRFERLEGDILYFALNTFNDEEVVTQFEEYLDELGTARAVVLDIRNNGGGNSRNGWNIGRYFSETPLEVSHWKTRTQTAAFKAWGRFSEDPERKAHAAMDAWYEPAEFGSVDPPEPTFNMPVAVLMGSSTYSAAEDFLAYMRANPRCIFVGGPSAGSTGQPLAFKIPGGAWVGITSKRDTMPDGTEFVGIGVLPDIEVNQTVADFRAGRDLVLERALDVLVERLR